MYFNYVMGVVSKFAKVEFGLMLSRYCSKSVINCFISAKKHLNGQDDPPHVDQVYFLHSDSDCPTQMSPTFIHISFVDFLHFCFTLLRFHSDRVYLTGSIDACFCLITVYFGHPE